MIMYEVNLMCGDEICNICIHASLQQVYYVTEAVQTVDETRCSSSWCTDVCILSLCIRFESHMNERST